MSSERVDDTIMSLGELSRTVRYHDKDLYRGNGKKGITTRLDALEDYKERTEADLYAAENGVVPQLTKFFAVLNEREKQAANKMTKYVAIMAFIAIAAPITWDLMKHAFGWMR